MEWWTVRGTWCSWPGTVPLSGTRSNGGRVSSTLLITPDGIELARRNAAILTGRGIDGVFSSPLGPAATTARIFAECISGPVVIIEQLTEVHHGRFAGMTNAEINARHPGELDRRSRDKYSWRFPGGESYADAYLRAARALTLVAAHPVRRPLIVSHDMIGRMLQRCLLGLEPSEALAIRHPHDVIYAIDPQTAVRRELRALGPLHLRDGRTDDAVRAADLQPWRRPRGTGPAPDGPLCRRRTDSGESGVSVPVFGGVGFSVRVSGRTAGYRVDLDQVPGRAGMVARALWLVTVSVVFGVVSGVVSVASGLSGHSLGVFAVGLDVLADVTLAAQSVIALASGSRPGTSPVTLIAAGVSLAVLTPLARAKRRLGRQMNSPALQGDGALSGIGAATSLLPLEIFEDERIAPGSAAAARLAGLAALDSDPAVAGRLAGIADRARRGICAGYGDGL
jgi:broad specificity phosphatase PhoE